MVELTLRPSDVTNLYGQDTGREHLSQRRISLLLACHRKYELDAVDRLELIARPRYFDMGAAFQKAIELQDAAAGPKTLHGWVWCETCRGTGVAGGVTRQEAEQKTRDAASLFEARCEACGGRGGKQGDGPLIISQEDEDRLRIEEATIEAAADLYLRRWAGASHETREVPYRIRLRNPATGAYSLTFDWLGYADGVIDCGGWLELIENKLVGQITALNIKKLPLDRQLALERYCLWRATGKEVRRVRYRWIRKPSIDRKKGRVTKAGQRTGAETVDEFIERLAADYADPDRQDFYSHPEEFFTDPSDALRVEGELWEWADQVRRQRRRRFFDRNTAVCHEYGGCQFIPICTGDPDAAGLYRVREHYEPPEAQAA